MNRGLSSEKLLIEIYTCPSATLAQGMSVTGQTILNSTSRYSQQPGLRRRFYPLMVDVKIYAQYPYNSMKFEKMSPCHHADFYR